MKRNANQMMHSLVSVLSDVRKQLDYKSFLTKITVFMTKDLATYLWKNTIGELSIAHMPDEMRFYGFPVKIIEDTGLKFWISVTDGEFIAEEEENE